MGGAENKKHWIEYAAVLVAAASALTSLAAAAFTYYQLQASKAQLDATKFDQRPWIALELQPAGPLTYDDAGRWGYVFGYKLTNVGKSPAFNVTFTANMFPLAPPMDSEPASGYSYPEPVKKAQEATKQMCDASSQGGARGFGQMLFPGSDLNGKWKADDQSPASGYRAGFLVVACVTYRSNVDSTVHQTARVFALESAKITGTISRSWDGTISQALSFLPFPLYSATAD